MPVKKLNFNEAEVKQILGGPIRIFFLNETVGTEELMFLAGDFAPGEGLEAHNHEVQEEVYYCVSGNGTVWYGEDMKETAIGPGDALWIPMGVQHAVKNTGKEQLIIGFFLALRRRRQYYRKWEEEERLASTDFDYGDPDEPERPDDDEPWRR